VSELPHSAPGAHPSAHARFPAAAASAPAQPRTIEQIVRAIRRWSHALPRPIRGGPLRAAKTTGSRGPFRVDAVDVEAVIAGGAAGRSDTRPPASRPVPRQVLYPRGAGRRPGHAACASRGSVRKAGSQVKAWIPTC
jgi:hypothetical protein